MALKVLLLDDNSDSNEHIINYLKDLCDLSMVNNSKDCLDAYQEQTFNAVVMNVITNAQACYDACKAIRKIDENEETTIIFISKNGSLEEKIRGFEVGGDDYLIEPFSLDELGTKIKSLNTLRSQRSKFKTKYKESNKKALNIMNEMAEIGEILNFLDKSFQCENYEKLVENLFYSLEGLDLSATVQIRSDTDSRCNYRDEGVLTPLEVEVFDRLGDQGRLLDFGSKTIFNYDHFSLLIRNMPIDDKLRYGRLRDSLAILSSGANARIKAIRTMENLQHRNDSVEAMVRIVSEEMEALAAKAQAHGMSTTQIIDDLMINMEKSLGSLGLSEEQENYFISLVDKSMEGVVQYYTEGMEIDRAFERILGSMKKTLAS